MAVLVSWSVLLYSYLSRVIFRVRNGAKQHPSLTTKMAAAWIVDRQDRIYLIVVLTTFFFGFYQNISNISNHLENKMVVQQGPNTSMSVLLLRDFLGKFGSHF